MSLTDPPYGDTITVAGLPVGLTFDGNGQYVTATFENVFLNEAPLQYSFDPPVASIGPGQVTALTAALATAIQNGAIIELPTS